MVDWFAIYVGLGIPVLVVGLGFAVALYDRWERRRGG